MSSVANRGTEMLDSPVATVPRLSHESKSNRPSNTLLKTQTCVPSSKKKKVKIEDLIAQDEQYQKQIAEINK